MIFSNHGASRTLFLVSLALVAAALTPACAGSESGSGGDTGGGYTAPPPAAKCQGTALTCDLRPENECQDLSTGCYWLGACSGFARDCHSFFSSFSCETQDGCSWSSIGSGSCSGSVKECEEFPASIGCGYQEGCTWTPGCSGDAHDCDKVFDEDSCGKQPGCYWG